RSETTTPEGPRNTPRIGESRDVSQVSAAPVPQVIDRLVRQGVETAGGDVGFELLVPDSRVEFREPGTKCRQLLGGQALHGSFNLFDCAHSNAPQFRDNSRQPISMIAAPARYVNSNSGALKAKS